MKLHHFLLALSILGLSCHRENKSQDGEDINKIRLIRVKGSETVRPVIEKVIQQYSVIHPDIYIEYEGGGSNIGIPAIKQNEADIAFMSRPFSEQEKREIDTVNKYICRPFAYDGLTIIVHLSNPVNEINISQLRGIYAGYIKNWKEVGGKDMPILVYSRDISSGTYLFFKEHVMDSLDYRADDINLVHNKEISSNVIENPHAIGYMGHGDILPNVKVLKLAAGSSKNFIEPTYASIKSKEYPLSRTLYYVYHRNAPSYVMQFDSFLTSKTSQQIISEVGFIPR
ncbi:MAG TPA: phosphate ABC transporter substrate-binding protein [Bacteroidia bacterium]|nr:phosphate ABC transporter substrate-binding protein [Bacteroidia bacterium]